MGIKGVYPTPPGQEDPKSSIPDSGILFLWRRYIRSPFQSARLINRGVSHIDCCRCANQAVSGPPLAVSTN